MTYCLQGLPTAALQAAEKKGKGNSLDDALPASLRKLNQLKAAALASKVRNVVKRPNSTEKALQSDRDKEKGAGKLSQKGRTKAQKPEGSIFADIPTLKLWKKEFLNKKKKMNMKKGKSMNPTNLSDKEQDLFEKAAASKPAFGEVAAQPLKVNLKRRHWDNQKREAERLKDLFLRQMKDASARSQPGSVDEHNYVPTYKRNEPTGEAIEMRRKKIIDSYRKSKRLKLEKQGRALGTATAQSLAALVRREAEGAFS